MSTEVVFGQMLIVFALMFAGLLLCKCNIISKASSKDFSALVVNVCSPALLIMSVFTTDAHIEKSSLVLFFGYSMIAYVIMILFGYFTNIVLKIPKHQRGDYQLMTIFGNCGFIGIPVAQALFGPQSLVYVAAFNLCYNIFFYTYGFWIITSDIEGVTIKSQFKNMINPGTISCVITIVIFWFDLKIPVLIQDFCTYAGQPSTLLALVVIGISLADMDIKAALKDKKFFAFTFLRFLIFPIAFISVMKLFIADLLIRSTMALMIAVPVGNMPAMVRAQYRQDDTLTAKGAVITTTLSVITITIVCMFI